MARLNQQYYADNVSLKKEGRTLSLENEFLEKLEEFPDVIDSVTSDSSTDALSANMGRHLQDQIDQLSSVGTFLSLWDCTTGLPTTDPTTNPYQYKIGTYYIVDKVADAGGTNYRPKGSQYNAGVASTDVETEDVKVGDWYLYDGTVWIRQPNSGKEIVIDEQLSLSSRNAVENRVVTAALNNKQDTISDLETIRQGAAKGATSVQPGDNISVLTNNLGYQTEGDVVNKLTNYYTKTEVDDMKDEVDEEIANIKSNLNTKTFKFNSADFVEKEREDIQDENVLAKLDEMGKWLVDGNSVILQIDDHQTIQYKKADNYWYFEGIHNENSKDYAYMGSVSFNTTNGQYLYSEFGDYNISYFVPSGTLEAGKVIKGTNSTSYGWDTLTKNDVGLENVDNTSDLNKPISTATQAALDLKADNTDVDGLESRIETLETSSGSQGQEITNIETNITNIEGNITTIQGDITDIKGDITTIEGDITTIQGDISDIQDDIADLQAELKTKMIAVSSTLKPQTAIDLLVEDSQGTYNGTPVLYFADNSYGQKLEGVTLTLSSWDYTNREATFCSTSGMDGCYHKITQRLNNNVVEQTYEKVAPECNFDGTPYTQTEYDALPNSKNTDGIWRVIYE